MYRFTSHVRRCAQILLLRLAVVGFIGGCSMTPGYEQPEEPVAAGFSYYVSSGISTFPASAVSGCGRVCC